MYTFSEGFWLRSKAADKSSSQLGELAKQTNRLINCYSIGEQDRPLFEEAGWEVTKFGEETSLKLESLSWSGKPYEWVRRQYNYCQRMGLSCREVNHQTMDSESLAETHR